MLALHLFLLAASSPLALASSSSAPAAPTSLPTSASSSSNRGISARLSHGPGQIRRAKGYAKAKRDAVPPRMRHRQKRHSGGLDNGGNGVLEARADEEGLPPSWLLWAGARVDSKYNAGGGGFAAAYAVELTKRATNGEVTNHNLDTSYSATVNVGTPAQALDIVLDTGSSDLWVADESCTTGACTGMSTYDASSSSSHVNVSSTFSIEYGSGTASGNLVQDLVTLGGFSVASQTFAACNEVSSGLLSTGVSGIMGLSWQALAYSKATPWWITLAKSSSWSEPLFAFHLARYRNVANASPVEPDGGVATFGFLDSSLYSGDITYTSVSSDAQYWQIPMDKMTMQGKTVSLGSSNMAAIDTGTTLIGGPEAIITAIYANIPGSERMTGSYAPYFAYPCDTTVDFEITFGGFTIKITDQDFNLGRYTSDQTMCTGAAYVQSLSSSSPIQWIVGDAAIKNTYTVFRYNPAAVGFANLASDVTSSEAAQSTTIPDASAIQATSVPASISSRTASAASASLTSSGATVSASTSVSQTATEGTPRVVTATEATVSGSNGNGNAASTSGSSADAGASASSGSSSGAMAVRGVPSTAVAALFVMLGSAMTML
ncbi:endopeptidase [Kwoniella heveanensis CBS 569]|uniref:Endopeptidase n=1 Tax=Kwoniella heveanensis BCC8398 TaxID=1296120 RepID=A0A1B9GNP2_9TREE|nr:endopeptidase [Kwoniella heveanensis BCC8398]OCF45907.1 endopeptidase [Kwoniella heveanensis CBS 569]